jgi:transposase
MYPRIEVRLTSWQRQRLQQLRDQPPAPRVGKRAVCLLLSADGASNQLIAQATGLAPNTLPRIRRRWNQGGMASLKDAPRSGRPPKVTPAYRRALKEALRRGPLAYGYVCTTWSIARLNTHLQRVTGITICNDWLRQLVLTEGFVYRRPKHTLKGKRDEPAYRRAQKKLQRLKKGL